MVKETKALVWILKKRQQIALKRIRVDEILGTVLLSSTLRAEARKCSLCSQSTSRATLSRDVLAYFHSSSNNVRRLSHNTVNKACF